MGTELNLAPAGPKELFAMTGLFPRAQFTSNKNREVRRTNCRRVSPRLVQSIRATARQLGVSELTVHRHLRDGKLQGIQIGGTWRLAGTNIDRIGELPEDCTVTQVAHSFDVSVITVRRWINANQISARMPSRTWVIKRSVIEEILRPIIEAA